MELLEMMERCVREKQTVNSQYLLPYPWSPAGNSRNPYDTAEPCEATVAGSAVGIPGATSRESETTHAILTPGLKIKILSREPNCIF